MFVRRLPLLVVVTALVTAWLTALAPVAVAGPRADIEKRMSAAMESYDLLEYETARKLLTSALEIAKEGRLEDDPLVARVHLSLGIVYFAGLQDKAAARRSFIEAVTIDPKISLDPAYKTPDMSTLLETVRATSAASAPERPRPERHAEAGGVDCLTISGLKHPLVDHGRRGAPQRMTAAIGGDIQASKVSIFVRGARNPEYLEIKMTRDRECTYSGTIAGGAMNGDTIYYYVAALNAAGTVVASSGSPGAPNLIELSGKASSRPEEDENPLVATAEPPPEGSAEDPERTEGRTEGREGRDDGRDGAEPARVTRRATVRGGARKMLVGLGAASGIGYVTGETEQLRNKVQCCIAPGLFTLSAEVGYGLSSRLTLSAALRLGFPIGANVEGHSPLGPAGFVRARYALSPARSALYVMGQLGAGIVRNTVKLRTGTDGMDTDIVALGPLLAGTGIGYSAALSDGFRLVFDLSATAGIPVVGELGSSKLNFGVQVDATVGAALRF